MFISILCIGSNYVTRLLIFNILYCLVENVGMILVLFSVLLNLIFGNFKSILVSLKVFQKVSAFISPSSVKHYLFSTIISRIFVFIKSYRTYYPGFCRFTSVIPPFISYSSFSDVCSRSHTSSSKLSSIILSGR